MKSAYWPEATDDHGVYVGNALPFVEMCMVSHLRWRSTSHCIFNHHIELDADGSHARGEIYNVTYLFQKNADVLDTLAAAYAEDGRFEEAVSTQARALEHFEKDDPDRVEAEKRAELYRAKKPFRADP